MLWLDHLAVTARSLDEGVTAVEDALGLPLGPAVGQHPAMGTHNRLIACGDAYLEVIAIDPEAPAPGRPRWFRMDERSGPPRLMNWVARTDDLDRALEEAPAFAGAPMALARGPFRWRMAVPPDGRLPFDDAFPALIEWESEAHPAKALPDAGLRLIRLTVTHPEATALAAWALPRLPDGRLRIETGPPGFEAAFATPHGPRTLS
jgi:Glyoxalase-like domain